MLLLKVRAVTLICGSLNFFDLIHKELYRGNKKKYVEMYFLLLKHVTLIRKMVFTFGKL